MKNNMIILEQICIKYNKQKMEVFDLMQTYEWKIHSKSDARYDKSYYYLALGKIIDQYKKESKVKL
jgi:hypothetical protein